MVTLAEVKAFLQITDSTYDTLLTSYIAYVSAQVEAYCNNKFNGETTLTDQSVDTYDQEKQIVLPAFPVSNVTFKDGTTVLVNEQDYFVDLAVGVIYLEFIPEKSFSRYKVSLKCGYAIANVPQDLKLVVLQAIRALFEANSKAAQGSSNVKNKRLGDFSITYGDSGDADKVVESVFKSNGSLIDPYRRMIIF